VYVLQNTKNGRNNNEHVTYDLTAAGEAKGFVVHCSACKGQYNDDKLPINGQ